jgi:mono/diheme cytochrome c family protein
MEFKINFSAFAMSILLFACNSNNSSSNNTTEETPVTSVEKSKVEIKGQPAFEQKCAACHGNDGTAGIGNATNLQTSKLDSVSVAIAIANGKAGMPSFKEQLTKEEIENLSSYIITFRK